MLLFTCGAWAQMGTLQGTFTDAQTGEPVPFATIITTSNIGATTDFDGNYTLLLAAGEHQVKFSYVGYTDTTYSVTITEGKTTTLNHAANAQTQSLNIVTVTGAKYTKRLSEEVVSVEVLNKNIVYNSSSSKKKSKSYTPEPIPNTSTYYHTNENTFKDPTKDPLSTLSIDVDKASYSNIRGFLNRGQLPLTDAVRVEELINYFAYDYPQPTDGQPFSITMEGSKCPWNGGHQLVMVGIQGKQIQLDTAGASNLVFLIDVSGSMGSSDKLGLVKSGLRMLIENLGPKDYVTIVTYAGASGLALAPTSGKDKESILATLNSLESGGSTAGGEGIKLAYKMAREHFIKNGNNRVILATDGDFNVGISSDGELQKLIEKERENGVFLSVVGVGSDNLMDGRMNMLAEKGNGVYYYLDNEMEANKIFVQDMRSTLFTIAKDVKIQVEFNPALVKGYRLIGYETRLLNDEDFDDDQKDAGEIGAGHSVTALYEIIPAGSTEKVPGINELKYQKTVVTDASATGEIFTIKFRYKEPSEKDSKLIVKSITGNELSENTSVNFRFASAVVGFGMLLRDSEFKGTTNFELVQTLASSSLSSDPFGYRAEFLRLVGIAKTLTEQQKPIDAKK
jgi:Ca-activated chloride channel family protein